MIHPLNAFESDRNCQAVNSQTLLTERPTPGADAATAGGLLIGTMLICAAIGFGLGSLVGLAVAGGLIGLFIGLGAGFSLVYRRYKRI